MPIWTALCAAGWVRGGETGPFDFGTNLLPRLSRRGGCRRSMRFWLDAQVTSGAALTVGFPGQQGHMANSWLGTRLLWYANRTTRVRSRMQLTSIVSSRIGRRYEEHRDWMGAIRQICGGLAHNESLITSRKTTCHDFVTHCCSTQGVSSIAYRFTRHQTLRNWLKSIREGRWSADAVLVSPPVESQGLSAEQVQHTAVRDRLLIALPHRVIVLNMQPHGQIKRLLAARLNATSDRADMVQLAIGPGLINRGSATEFIRRGALSWHAVSVVKTTSMKSRIRLGRKSAVAGGNNSRPSQLSFGLDQNCLIHSTRSCAGPWPGQSHASFMDDLIWGRQEADHSILATLIRIVRQRRLMAGTAAIRGGQSVVCFSHGSLSRHAARRVYRPHRVRWDCESYGLAIDASWGRQRGIRPVVYGSETTWQRLTPQERPFFQSATSRAHSKIDWRKEREWRHLGDLTLDDLPRDQAVVFVPSEQDCDALSTVSPWPVVALATLPRSIQCRPTEDESSG